MSSANELSSFTLPHFANKLIQSGYINLPQMQHALIEKKKTGRSILDILQEITGVPLPPDFVRQYKKEQLFNLKILHGIDVFDPETYSYEWTVIEEIINTLIPFDVCRRHKMFPLKRRNNQPPSIVMAMVDPKDLDALNALKDIFRPKQLKLARKVVTPQDYTQLVEEYMLRQHSQDATEVHIAEEDLETIVDITDVFEDIPSSFKNNAQKSEEKPPVLDEGGPVVTLVNNILAKAIENRASEIHIEPENQYLNVRFRQDGIMCEAFDPIPKEIAAAVVSRLKLLANLDIFKRNIAQKGRMEKSFSGRKIDFWISTLPSQNGEKVILRVFDPRVVSLDLEAIITNDATRQLVKHLSSRSSGLLLVTGPESSGTSTTLYALLTQRNQLGVNIATVEDPIERSLMGMTQVEVNESKGNDYDTVLQAFLNQDVDVIGVDQIRGRNTAKTVIEAAFNHLVLTTLSTSDAASAIPRLGKMEVAPSLLADTLIGIINQRLVRRVCPVCRLSYQPEPAKLAKFGLSNLSKQTLSCYKANSLTPEAIEEAIAKGRLCRQCNGVGYKGQIGVFEVIGINQRLKALIHQESDAETLKKVAIQEGMKPLLNYGVELVLHGDTTLEELERVFPDLVASQPVQVTSSKTSISPHVLRRLQELEKLLDSFNREFKQLKEELIPETVQSHTDTGSSSRHEELRDPDNHAVPSKDIELEQQTMVSDRSETPDVSTYEELTDPGDWDKLKEDIESDKETLISDMSFDDDDSFEINVKSSFTSVTDPWSV